MENDRMITLSNGNKDNRKAFRRIGFSLIALTAIWIGLQELLFIGAQAFMPSLLDNSFAYFAIAELPLYLVAFPVYAKLLSRLPKANIERRRLGFGKTIGAFAISIFVMYVGNFIGMQLMNHIGSATGIEAENSVEALLVNSNPLANFIFAVVLAPIFEELIFRKVLIDRAARYGEGVAVLLSGLLFGMFHMNLYQFFYAFFLGMVFAYIYVKTRRIGYTIAFHAIINFLGGIVAPYIIKNLDLDALTSIPSQEQIMQMLPNLLIYAGYSLFMLLMAFIGAILLLAWRKRITFDHGEIIIPRGRKFSTVYLNGWMILFIAVCVAMAVRSITVYA